MDDSFAQRILTKLGVAILIIAALDLIFINYWIVQKSRDDSQKTGQEIPLASPPLVVSEPKSENSQTELQTDGPASNETGSSQAKTIVQTAQKEIFIPIGSGSTFSNSYIDLAGLEVSIDTAKYSAIESVVFEASIWVQDGNGKMYAQLYNAADKHPVWNSEISTSASKAVLTTSPKINLTTGNKTYKVQAKTNLTEYAAHVDNARIKITLK